MKPINTTAKAIHARYGYVDLLLCIIFLATACRLNAQELTISPRSSLVMNGNVSLVVNNAAFINNGSFNAGTGTVHFKGHNDTTVSYVSGSNSTTFYNLSITKSSYGLALKSSSIVRNILQLSAGTLYTDSNLVLRSDVNLTARVGAVPIGCNIVGKAHVERYFPSRRAWRLVTAPVTSSTTIYNSWQNSGVYTPGLGTLITGPSPTGAAGNGLDPSQLNNVSLKKWNSATQQLVNVVSTKVAASSGTNGAADNTGYFMFIRGDRELVNTNAAYTNITTITSIGALQTGTQAFAASGTINNYTLIGNPYASPVDFNSLALTNLIKRFYVWDPTINSLGGYVMLDDLDDDGIYSKSVVISNQTKDIQSSQAFFVQTNANAPASIIFNEGSKCGANNNMVFRPVGQGSVTGAGRAEISATLFIIKPDNTSLVADGVLAEFNNAYSIGVNLDDAVKFSNTNENLSIIRNNVALAAERRPEAGDLDTLFFRVTKTVKSNYRLVLDAKDFDQSVVQAFLEDAYLGKTTPVSMIGKTVVNFASDGTNSIVAANRFRLVFKPMTVVLPVTIRQVTAQPQTNNVMVGWKVENEINIARYEVERSVDGNSFNGVYTLTVNGVGGASSNYQWLDEQTVAGNNFYRIKAYDKNGEVNYSYIVKVLMNKLSGGFSIHPNPVTGNVVKLLMNDQPAGTYQITITNAAGQMVSSRSLLHTGGSSVNAIEINAELATGIYQLEVVDENHNHFTQKLIISK